MTAEQRKILEEVIEDLKVTGCSFWACPGFDAPFEDMATCRVCHSVQQVRKVLR